MYSDLQMFELLLNLTWFVIAGASLTYAVRKRDRAGFAAVFCAVALLFPIISMSDDLASADRSLEDGSAGILATVSIVFGLILLALLAIQTPRSAAFVFAVHADPRSPPRA